MLQSIQGFRLERPGVVLTPRPLPSTQQLAALERAELDVGFIWALPDRIADILDTALVLHEPMVAALPRGHALCLHGFHVSPLPRPSVEAAPAAASSKPRILVTGAGGAPFRHAT